MSFVSVLSCEVHHFMAVTEVHHSYNMFPTRQLLNEYLMRTNSQFSEFIENFDNTERDDRAQTSPAEINIFWHIFNL